MRSKAFLVLYASMFPSVAFALTADAGGPYTVAAGGSVTVTAAGSSLSGCLSGTNYDWDLNNDGTYELNNQTANTATFSAVGRDGPVAQTIGLRIQCNADSLSATDTAAVNITNVAPNVTNITVPSSINEGDSSKFTAVYSDPESADTHTIKWNFGDGTGDAVGTRDQMHTFADNGNFPTRVTVTDDDGGVGTFMVNVAVANVAPTITSSTLPLTGVEGSPLGYEIVATDPGADVLVYTWKWGDKTPDSSGGKTTHAYVNDGTFSVVGTVDDGDGGSKAVSGIVLVSNAPPVLQPIGGPANGAQGANLTFTASYVDPGANDVLTITWDFGDGAKATGGKTQSHAYTSEGKFTVTTKVCDDYLPPACDTETKTVTISNTNPTADVTGPTTGKEGDLLAFTCTGKDPGNDPLTYDWKFGDGSVATNGGTTQSHKYVDEGSYTIDCTAKDPGGATGVDAITVAIANAPPSITSTPAVTVVEGSKYAYTPTATDPGAGDTLLYGVAGPEAMTISGTTHAIAWETDWPDLGKHDVTLTVVDNDGARTEQKWSIEVTLLDADGDTMSDNWETEHGLDPAAKGDALLDPDGDGRDNLREWTDRTAPQVYEGPSVPVVTAPLDGDEVATATVTLEVENASSPTDETLTYGFEVYANEEMTEAVTSDLDVAEEASGETSFDIDKTLTENTWYWWWASAEDQFTTGDWTPPTAFFYNTKNDAPTAPGINQPLDGAATSDVSPVLVIDGSTDVDEDVLTYTIVLTKDDGTTALDTEADIVPNGPIASWSPDVVLSDGLTYCWYGFATDEHGLDGARSETACFDIDLSNESPSAPLITSPEDGAVAATNPPTITVTNGVDPEGRATSHYFELDTSDTFDGESLQSAIVASGETQTSWTPEVSLAEDTAYHLRVLTDDGVAVSEWAVSTFTLSTVNDPPTVPALANPPEGAAFATSDALVIVNSADPENDALMYDFVIRDANGDDVQSEDGVAEDESGETSWTPAALEPGVYQWTARADDGQGGVSEFAEPRSFEVMGEEDTDPPDTDPPDTDPPDTDPPVVEKKCGCAGTPAAGGYAASLLFLLVGVRRRAWRRSAGAK